MRDEPVESLMSLPLTLMSPPKAVRIFVPAILIAEAFVAPIFITAEPPVSKVKVFAPPDCRVTAPSPVKVAALMVAASKVVEIEAIEAVSWLRSVTNIGMKSKFVIRAFVILPI